MRFRVEISDLASEQYDKILTYIYFVLKNPQAADNLMRDFNDIMTLFKAISGRMAIYRKLQSNL